MKKPQRRKDDSVNVPMWWIERVCALCGSRKQVLAAVILLRMSAREKRFGCGIRKVKLANKGLAKWGIGPRTKNRMLLALENRLLDIERRPRKSPIVTMRLVD